MASQALKFSLSLSKTLALAAPLGTARRAHSPFWRFWMSSTFSSSHNFDSTSNNLLQDNLQDILATSDEPIRNDDTEINQHPEVISQNISQQLSTVSDEFPDHHDPGNPQQKAESSQNLSTEDLQHMSSYPTATKIQRPQLGPRGIYKAILLGEVGQAPVQKILKNGRTVTIFSVGTGGMHNNRRPLDEESPEDFAEKSFKQWHRVAIYQDRVGVLAMRHMRKGTQVYLEGDIETRVYNDPATNAVKRIREIAVRQNGRVLFMESPRKSFFGSQLHQDRGSAESEVSTQSFSFQQAF
ncbi:hypothetical protein O6H91_13G092400 [Diphasiastrum complanatum]|uniref:Uncharacterized protein n=1 Tax=Diphasiastrum complanatum TaxID=34168 RepID=A0ACC2BXA9_DIPCM|nr:hypothetical protein O6H91_13G092400 [Diphasiastrum complanatum]